jgi:outer membrane protein assembly factor BamB
LFIFFTAECSVCSLPDALKNYVEFARQQKSRNGQAEAVTLIFDFNFARTDILDQLQQAQIDAPAYIANEELTAVSDLGRLKSFDNGQVVAVRVDGEGTILKLSSLDTLRAEAQSANAPAASAETARTSQRAAVPGKPHAAFAEMFPSVALAAYDVTSHGGKSFVTDLEGNRILVFNADGRLEKEIGRIGSGPGRLLHPGYIDIGRDGTIYVQDGGNDRIERFSAEGQYLGDFTTTDYEGFAVGARNEIYLGQPEKGSLVTVYSETGKPLRSFGQLKKYSDLYGPQQVLKDAAYKVAANRVRLSVDGDGNIYVSFLLAPLLQKYSPDGKLLFERTLEGGKIDFLKKVLETKKYISTGRDGVEARTIALDPIIDPATGNILVMLVDGSIYVADREGRKIDILYEQRNRELMPFYPFMAGLGANGEVIVIPFQQRRCFKLISPDNSKDGVVARAMM